MDNEIWKPIVGYEGIYEVSNKGRIKSLSRKIDNGNSGYISNEKIYLGSLDKDGYLSIKILRKKCRAHRLVAIAFKSNPNNYPLVLHLDNDRTNNNDWNLKWGTPRDNIKQCHSEGRANNKFQNSHPNKGKFGGEHPLSKKVHQFTKDSKFIKEWDSMRDAQYVLGISASNISNCCRSKIKSSGGFIWRYAKK